MDKTDLPSDFDFIVLGTGLPEAILAAAFSRNGYKVLHLDKNPHYSDKWASFNLKGIEKFAQEDGSGKKEKKNLNVELSESEKLLQLATDVPLIENVKVKYYVPEEPICVTLEEDLQRLRLATDKKDTEVVGSEEAKNNTEEDVKSTEATNEKETLPTDNDREGSENQKTHEETKESEEKTEVQEDDKDCQSDDLSNQTKKKKIWIKKDIEDSWRHYNIDLAPKILYSSGKIVELLISSDVAKYCEFKTISRVLTQSNSKLEKIPCCRADVFSSKDFSMLDKRKLMKFLEWCAGFNKNPEAYQEYLNEPLHGVLKTRNLPEKIQNVICRAIAMVTPDTPTKEALEKIQIFLQSVGRYGNTPFLFPLYGTGELPQAFCRLCAVFGGIYCLHMSADALVINSSNKCEAIITSEGQRINCKWLIGGASYFPQEYTKAGKQLSRCVLLTDGSLLQSSSEELSLLWIPPNDSIKNPITCLELPHSSMVCPKDMYLVHLTMEGTGNPETDFLPVIQQYYCTDGQPTEITAEDAEKPSVLWSCYFSQKYDLLNEDRSSLPDNVYLFDGPNTNIHMDEAVIKAREIFEEICPGDLFLPKPPHPDDIIFVDDTEASVGGGEAWDAQQEAKEKDGKADKTEVAEEEVKSQDEGTSN